MNDVSAFYKTISDAFNLNWKSQIDKVKQDFLSQRLGACLAKVFYGGTQYREVTCIHLDRIPAYLYSINPEKVKAAGNIEGAKYLRKRQLKWDEAMMDCERHNGLYFEYPFDQV